MLFSGSSHPQLAKEIASTLNVNEGKALLGCFQDKEIGFRVLDDVKNKEVFVVQSMAPDPNFSLVELLIMIDALKRASAKSITAIVPWLAYSRQDRFIKPKSPISAKLVANMIKLAGASKIITFDLHAPQVEGFFEIPIDNISCRPILIEKAKGLKLKKPIIVSSDFGGAKLAKAYVNGFSSEIAILGKKRVTSTEAHCQHFFGDVKNQDVIIVDDICATAGTVISAAKACKERGANRIILLITHGLFVGDAIQKIEDSPIEKVICTNTIPWQNNWAKSSKIEYISICSLLK